MLENVACGPASCMRAVVRVTHGRVLHACLDDAMAQLVLGLGSVDTVPMQSASARGGVVRRRGSKATVDEESQVRPGVVA